MNLTKPLSRSARIRPPVSLDRFLIEQGNRMELGGNQPVQLGAGNSAWFIAHGKVEVFVAGRPGGPPVERWHLATCAANELVLAASTPGLLQPRPPLAEDGGARGQLELVAIPHPGTQLIPLDSKTLGQLACDPARAVSLERLIANWVSRLQAVLSPAPVPSSGVPIGAGEEVRLASDGVAVRATGRLVWLSPSIGCTFLWGHERLALRAGEGPLPLCGGAWLLTRGEAVLAGSSTREILENDRFWPGICQLHRIVLRHAEGEMQARIEADRARLRRRIELHTHVLRAAHSRLAAILDPQVDDKTPAPLLANARQIAAPGTSIPEQAPSPGTAIFRGRARGAEIRGPAGDPLAEACRLNCERLGVSLLPPPDLPRHLPALQRLQRLCDASRMYSRKVLLRDDWWRHDHGPLLAFRAAEAGNSPSEDPGNPVALLPSSATSYELVDPQHGTAIPVDASVAAGLAREAFMFYPVSTESRLHPRVLLRPALHRHRREILAITLIAIGGGLLGVLVPIMTGIIYGRIIPGGHRSEVVQLALLLVAAAVGASAFQVTRALSILRLTSKLDLRLQPNLWGRLLALPVSFFRRYRVGDLAERIQGFGAMREILLADVTTTALALVVSITSFALMFYFSWRLALLATVLLACLIGVTVVLAIPQLQHRRRSLEVQGRISSLAFALVQGIAKLRTAGAEARAYGTWATQFAEQRRYALKAQRLTVLQTSLNSFFLVAAELALFATMGFNERNRLAMSGFLAFSAAFGQVLTALMTFISLIPELLSIFPIYERLRPVLEEATEADETKTAIELAGDLEVSNVSFRYQQGGPLILAGVSLKARRGEFIAIVGPSGSGKSTLVRLLLGFERPESGTIRYDDRDLTSLDLKALRRQIGAVLQSSKPITGDIFTNIVGGTNNDLEAAWEAARIAGIDKGIRAMPMGMHTIIGEGATTFSGGERQRLMIARAVVRRPRILLLDEATSALDNPTQNHVQQCLEQLNATRVVVAHRLSTIQHADRIYVLDRGRIAEEGTFEELRMNGGYFAELLGRQSLLDDV